MMAEKEFHHQKYYSRWFLTISVLALMALAMFQLDLPQLGSNQVIGINQRRHNYYQQHHHHDYEIFTFPSEITTYASEVPRYIMGTEVRYIIANPVCDSPKDEELFMLILITSYVGDVKMRRKIREILPQSQLDEIKTKRLFLLAKPPPPYQYRDPKYADVKMAEIYRENEEHHDILMGDFTESYRNLTYKHVMGLDYAATFCSNAKYILKQDDDSIVDYYQLRGILVNDAVGKKLLNAEHPAIYGKLLDRQYVERKTGSKWFVSKEEYREALYPPYVSGWGYVTTVPAIQEILKVSEIAKYFFIDDVLVTGILREKTSVSIIDMGDYYTPYRGQLLCCVSTPMFARSKKNEPYWCDYLVGPSDDDLELMEICQRHSQYCYVSKQCKQREGTDRLVKKCVISDTMMVNDFSQFHGPPKAMAVIRKQ